MVPKREKRDIVIGCWVGKTLTHFLCFSLWQNSYIVMKTFKSTSHPVKGDIMDDPLFDSRCHHRYLSCKSYYKL